jgi:hypothetical protein
LINFVISDLTASYSAIPRLSRLWNILTLLIGIPFLSCCSTNDLPPGLTEDVQARAITYYTITLPEAEQFDPTPEIRIKQAWRGKTVSESTPNPNDESEVWCLELAISGTRVGLLVDETAIWIAVKSEEQAKWSSAALVTISALGPHEACSRK